MEQIDWTAIIVALVGSGGLLAAIVTARIGSKKTTTDRGAEERATARVSTPITGDAVHDVEAIRMAKQAMAITTRLSDELKATEDRLGEVEKELGILRRSYQALYQWAQRIIREWED